MSLRTKLVLCFAAAFGLGFAALGYGAVRVTGDTIERGLTDRLVLAKNAIAANPAFFIHEASLREKELRQLADISGFEVVVLSAGETGVAGSSLPGEDAEAVRADVASRPGDRAVLNGTEYRVVRARAAGRALLLLAPEAPVADAKARARRPLFYVVGLGLILSLLLGTTIAASVTRPLRLLAERVGEVREGRLDVEMPAGGSGEVADLAQAFSRMIEGLRRYREELISKEKLAALGGFSAAVAHELRNPLSGIRMTLQMLRRTASEDVRADLDLVLSEMERLDHSVEELLFHAGEPRYAMRPVDLRVAVTATCRALAPLAGHLGVLLSETAPEQPVGAHADESRIRQAVMNLVLNALQASPPSGRVEIDLTTSGGRALLTVTDDGPGVPEALQPRLFSPFASGRAGGTGLGLANTRAIARAHGGEVTYERRQGRTVFRLDVPAGEGPWPASS